jgi:hypothetical protein
MAALAAEPLYCAQSISTCAPSDTGSFDGPLLPGIWPTRSIAVVIAPKIKQSKDNYAATREMLTKVHQVSGYNFYECDETKIRDLAYIYFDNRPKDDNKCYSEIGFGEKPLWPWLAKMLRHIQNDQTDDEAYPNRRLVSIGEADCNSSRKLGIAHEIMHRLGVKHEHANPESGKYLEPKLAVKEKIGANQFDQPSPGFEHLRFDAPFKKDVDPYDLVSVMHYGMWAFNEVDAAAQGGFSPLYKFIKRNYVRDGKFLASYSDIGQRKCISAEDARFLRYLTKGGTEGGSLPCDKDGLSKMKDACELIEAVPIASVGEEISAGTKRSSKRVKKAPHTVWASHNN